MPLICRQLGIAYFPVPKVASTSIKLLLLGIETGQTFTHYPDAHLAHRTHAFRPEDIAETEGLFRVAVVRDPIKRLLSTWGNRVIHSRDIEKSIRKRSLPRRANFWLRGGRTQPSADRYFSDLALYHRFVMEVRHHTAPTSDYLGPDLSVYDAVYRIEEMDALQAEIANRLGRPMAIPREQTQGPKVTLEDLSPKAQRAVKDITADRYAYLSDYYAG